MVIGENERLIKHIKGLGRLKSREVEDALRKVKREFFVPDDMKYLAYRDAPLYIGSDQTISEPSTVVVMTEALDIKEGQKILEIGTGSGWQAAILAELVGEKGMIYTVEIIKDLVDFAKENMEKLKIKNIKVLKGDGSMGLRRYAPYDRIVVTAGSPEIPKTLLSQLKPNGIMVIPIGNLYLQRMYVVKKAKGGIEKKAIGSFMFVPLTG